MKLLKSLNDVIHQIAEVILMRFIFKCVSVVIRFGLKNRWPDSAGPDLHLDYF